MMINSLHSRPLPGAVVVPVTGAPRRSQAKLESSESAGGTAAPHVDAVAAVRVGADGQQRRQAQRLNNHLLPGRETRQTGTRHRPPTAGVLSELIKRMGGAGLASGPGSVVDISL